MKTVLVCAAVAAASVAASAQEKRAVIVQDQVVQGQIETAIAPNVARTMTNTFQFISAEAGISPSLVKGAPYSATTVTETVQTLADGNRITHTNSASVARDSQGRTRREQSFPMLGQWTSDGPAPKMTTINDPVAGVTYVLEDQTKTVRKLEDKGPMKAKMKAEAMGAGGVAVAGAAGNVMFHTIADASSNADVIMFKSAAAGGLPVESQPKVEQLGQKSIEGVVADGARATVEIPAGAVGNERPIEIVDERWYSQELHTTVMSRHSDPRSGETTFRLTNVSRSDPAPSLFEVPADYKVEAVAPKEIRIDHKQE
jgi:hypothetical protein